MTTIAVSLHLICPRPSVCGDEAHTWSVVAVAVAVGVEVGFEISEYEQKHLYYV
jgi:hypothetical protein